MKNFKFSNLWKYAFLFQIVTTIMIFLRSYFLRNTEISNIILYIILEAIIFIALNIGTYYFNKFKGSKKETQEKIRNIYIISMIVIIVTFFFQIISYYTFIFYIILMLTFVKPYLILSISVIILTVTLFLYFKYNKITKTPIINFSTLILILITSIYGVYALRVIVEEIYQPYLNQQQNSENSTNDSTVTNQNNDSTVNNQNNDSTQQDENTQVAEEKDYAKEEEKRREETAKNHEESLDKVVEAITANNKIVENLNVDQLAYPYIPEISTQGFKYGIYDDADLLINNFDQTEKLDPTLQYTYNMKLTKTERSAFLTPEEYSQVQTKLVDYDIAAGEYASLIQPLLDYETLISAQYGEMYYGKNLDNMMVGEYPKAGTNDMMISVKIAQSICASGKCNTVDELVNTPYQLELIAFDKDGKEYTKSIETNISGIYFGTSGSNEFIMASNK